MYQALKELMHDEIAESIEASRKQGLDQGKALFSQLADKLLSLGKIDELKHAAQDSRYCDELMSEYGII